jgi:hypothetical protein
MTPAAFAGCAVGEGEYNLGGIVITNLLFTIPHIEIAKYRPT